MPVLLVDEGLVVETGREELPEAVDRRQRIAFQRGKSILVADSHTVARCSHTGADVRDAVDVDQAVRTAARVAEQSAGPVVFEAAGEDPNAVTVERGSDGIPLARFDLATAEGDLHGAGLSAAVGS